MSLRDRVRRLRTDPHDLEREQLALGVTASGATPINQVVPRQLVVIVGEVRSLRIVPRAGAPSLEVTIDDGHGIAVAIFYGRRTLAGVGPGRQVRLTGRTQEHRGRLQMVNPAYEFVK